MYDRPTAPELLDAVRTHLETHVVPAVKGDGKLYFQTLVAINVLRVVERELQLAPDHMAHEWARLDALSAPQDRPDDPRQQAAALRERNKQLCAQIRAGDYDGAAQKAALFEHVLTTSVEQLQVANPRFLQALAQEDAVKPL
ncbi:MAG: hypothetical protein HXY40_01100 [Chloroflexi bacterium]|nr:hypothetical protein [Chloroflexota bacterium]